MCFFLVSNYWDESFDPKINGGLQISKFYDFWTQKTWLFSVAEKHVFWHFTDRHSLLDQTFYPNN